MAKKPIFMMSPPARVAAEDPLIRAAINVHKSENRSTARREAIAVAVSLTYVSPAMKAQS
jgi:hypothetical protein